MRKSRLLLLCLCFALSGYAVQAQRFAMDKDSTSSATIRNSFPNIFRPIGGIFKKLFGKKPKITEEYYANLNNLTLNRDEVVASCSINQNFCEGNMKIEVFTEANDPENDALTYRYVVSGGKIIGEGNKIVWDLSGEKPGTYKIAAGVDDGCGVCGYTKTQEIRVIECPECK